MSKWVQNLEQNLRVVDLIMEMLKLDVRIQVLILTAEKRREEIALVEEESYARDEALEALQGFNATLRVLMPKKDALESRLRWLEAKQVSVVPLFLRLPPSIAFAPVHAPFFLFEPPLGAPVTDGQ